MNIIEKFGLVFIISASAAKVSSNETDILTYIIFLLGLMAFLMGDTLLTKRAPDVCHECGTTWRKGVTVCPVCDTRR